MNTDCSHCRRSDSDAGVSNKINNGCIHFRVPQCQGPAIIHAGSLTSLTGGKLGGMTPSLMELVTRTLFVKWQIKTSVKERSIIKQADLHLWRVYWHLQQLIWQQFVNISDLLFNLVPADPLHTNASVKAIFHANSFCLFVFCNTYLLKLV